MSDKSLAIQTSYKGYRFRSRLEARWAVFFDTLGLSWVYESEGFDLGRVARNPAPLRTWYLPDFWIADWSAYIEIKPTREPDPNTLPNEIAMYWALNMDTEQLVILIEGDPYPNEYTATSFQLRQFGGGRLDGNGVHSSSRSGLEFQQMVDQEDGYIFLREKGNYDLTWAVVAKGSWREGGPSTTWAQYADSGTEVIVEQNSFTAHSTRLMSAYNRSREIRFEGWRKRNE